jgi:hypothetical protein
LTLFQRIVIKIYYSIHQENLPGGPSGGFQEPSPMFSILFLLDPFQRIVIKIYYSIHQENLPGGPSGGFQEPSHMFSIIFLLDPLSKNCHKNILFNPFREPMKY